MTTTVELGCKRFCVRRCLLAVSLAIAMQYVLLTVFLLFVNFSIIHPIAWITDTFGLIFSFYTWLCIMPLLSSIILYGIHLGNLYLATKRFYPTRFSWLCGTLLKKAISLLLHGVVGFLTAWLYSRFLHEDYRVLVKDCVNGSCLNEKYVFLAMAGLSFGIYFFCKERLTKEPEVSFPVIQECKYVILRSKLYSVLYNSLLKSFVPTLCYTAGYWLLGWIVTRRVASLFGVQMDDSFQSVYSAISNIRLILYVWILSSQILSNMYLMDVFFSTLLTEEKQFPIEKPMEVDNFEHVSLVDVLATDKIPVAQYLASFDLFNIANAGDPARRMQIFSLSVPGGHPYNWKQLSGQCLSTINHFTEELSVSIKSISIVHNIYQNQNGRLKPTATEAAEKILLRQYNENIGIRNLSYQQQEQTPRESEATKRINDLVERIGKNVEKTYRNFFNSIPGLAYIFSETEGAKTSFLLSNSQNIIWISQGLAGLCAASLREDKFGVVQSDLPVIIKSLIKLKIELDQISNINLNGKKIDRNCIALKNAIRTSLYRICTVFGDYMKDIILDPDDLREIQSFIMYTEI